MLVSPELDNPPELSPDLCRELAADVLVSAIAGSRNEVQHRMAVLYAAQGAAGLALAADSWIDAFLTATEGPLLLALSRTETTDVAPAITLAWFLVRRRQKTDEPSEPTVWWWRALLGHTPSVFEVFTVLHALLAICSSGIVAGCRHAMTQGLGAWAAPDG